MFTETFSTDLSGWTNNIDPTKWIASTQAVRVSFTSSLLPQNAAIEGGGGASGGAFAGDFRAAGAEALGFSFVAENTLPSVLKLEITSGTNVFFQDLRPRMTPAGTTNHFLVSLLDRDAARWSGFSGSEFSRALTNVVRVAIRVTTSGTAAQAYRIDDVFLDRLPAVTAFAALSGTATAVSFAPLRTGFTYRVQAAADLVAGWDPVGQRVATNSTETINVTNSAPLFLRLEN